MTTIEVADDVIVLLGVGTGGESHVAAHRRSNGEVLWTIRGASLFGEEGVTRPRMSFNGLDALYLAGAPTRRNDQDDEVLAVSPSTGELQWRAHLEGSSGWWSVDRHGNLFVGATRGQSRDLRSYTPDGRLRWHHAGLESPPSLHAIHAGRLTFLDGQVLDASNGQHLSPARFDWNLPEPSPDQTFTLSVRAFLGWKDSLTAMATVSLRSVSGGSSTQYKLASVSNLTGDPLSVVELPLPEPLNLPAETLLTSRGSLLYRVAPGGVGTGALIEMSLGGHQYFACPLGLPEKSVFGFPVLTKGYWVVAVRDTLGSRDFIVAFKVDGLAPATKGWTGRDRRER